MADIVVVQKKHGNESHKQSLEILLSFLKKLNISHELFSLEEIYSKKMSYCHPSTKELGFRPQKKLVISLGGDGTLLHASHYVGHDVRLLGINSSPDTSVGHMCVLKPNEIPHQLEELINNQNRYKFIHRLQVSLKNSDAFSSFDIQHNLDFEALPLCLNDVLICNRHPAGTTRVQLGIYDRKTQKAESLHNIFSSGLWVSTAMGQTAAISSYDFKIESKDSDAVFVAVREPYFPKNTGSYPNTFLIHNFQKQLRVLSQMRGDGLICIDGPESCTSFQDGDTVIFNSPREAALKLVL